MDKIKAGDILIRTTTKARYEVMRVLGITERALYERYELEKVDTRRKKLINEFYLSDGSFRKLSDKPEDKITLLQDGDYVEHRGLHNIERLGPIRLQDGHILYTSQKFKGLAISIQQHRILAIIRNGETIHRFD